MKKLLLIIAFVCIVVFAYCKCTSNNVKVADDRVQTAYKYCKNNGYNSDYCFFVDFSQDTQTKRFMVYDFNKKKVVFSCYCAHGNDGSSGSLQTDENSFSNEVGSHKSSLGKYKVGKRRYINSIDGTMDVSMYQYPCYETHGLDKTNSNAHKRGILIHPMPGMDSNWFFIPPWVSLGCFSVGLDAFDKLSEYIESSSKPMLLWAYYK